MDGLSSRLGAAMAEAASACLDDCGHGMPARLAVDGEEEGEFDLAWWAVDDQIRRTWADEPFASEQGAYGIAILVVREIRGLSVLERSRKGTGFDYWMGEATDLLFTDKVRLEISGIRRGADHIVAARVKQKARQISASSGRLRGIVVVVEFSTPLARMVDQ